jgi:hypothetical protein
MILEKKVFKVKPIKDERGRYIPFCNYSWHQGIPSDNERCEVSNCKHYQRLYLK